MTISRRALMANAVAMSSMAAACASAPATDAPDTPSDALGSSDATAIAARIRNREITASEALEAAIARAERVNPQLNFIASPMYDVARERARGALSGPFAGVPTLIKDLLPVTGWPTHYGSRAFARFVPTEQPPYTDALFAAGLVPFAKSTTPEFGLTATTEPLLGGPTHNPWDVTRSSGGSSGGAGVAVGARVVPIAHASDGGGSIRIPASCNGVFGLKVSRGRAVISEDPDEPISISVNGCLSISVRDTAAWLAATEQTGASVALPPVGVVSGPNRQRLRIAISIPDARDREPSAEVRAATEAAAELCRSLGHEVREARPNVNGGRFTDDFVLVWAAGAAEVVALVQSQAPAGTPLDQLLEPLTLGLAAHYQSQGADEFAAAIGRLRQVEAELDAFFQNHDVLLTPVLSKVPPPLGELSPSLGMDGFEAVKDYVGYTPLQNVAGTPGMSVPLAWSAGGLPIGAHFSAARGQERRLLELAYELEQARPWASRRPAVNAG